jgi:hypothetical protein
MIGAYLKDTVVIKTVTRGAWGEPSTISTSVSARIERKTKLVRNQQGENVTSEATIYMKNRTIRHTDKITYDGIDHSILSIAQEKDFGANVVLMVYV